VRLWKFGAISGTVADEAGEPLVGVRVSAYRRTIIAGNRRYGARVAALTDDRGIYRIGNLVPGEYVVGMGARTTAMPASRALALPAFSSRPPTIADSMIQVGDAIYPLGRGVPIPPPPSGDRMFVYPAAFYPSTSGPPTVVTVGSGEERTAIDLQLHPVPSARISGTVAGPEGPASNVSLLLAPTEFGELPFEEEISMTGTDGTGAFVFLAVPTGQYSIRSLPGGGRGRAPVLWADVPVAVGSTNVDGIAVVLQPGLHISGRVDFEGSAERPSPQRLQQVPIAIEPAEIPSVIPPSEPTRIDPTGAFTTPGLPPSRYFVRVRDSPVGWMFKSATYNGRNVADVPLDLQGGNATGVVITFTDRWTGFRGTVQSADRLRNDEAIVLLFPTDPQAWSSYGRNPRRLKSARTAKTGEYSFTSVPPGDYYMVALPDEQATDWQDPQFLETLASVATHVTITDGEQKTQNLRMRGVR
jgi:hypothetical protein